MKKMSVRQMMIIAGSVLVCSIPIVGCYPVIPAYFAAAYLQEVNSVWLMAVMYIGMFIMLPLTAAVKYAVALIVTVFEIWFIRWANERCTAFAAGAAAAAATVMLSFCGGLLSWQDQPGPVAVLCEGILIIGLTILFHRLFYLLLEWKPVQKEEMPACEPGRKEKLNNYAESFEELSRIFMNMSSKREIYTAEDLGKIQNELTGRLCAGCDSCAICWERDATPLYGILSEMVLSVFKTGMPEKANEEELGQYCKRNRDMTEEAVRVFEKVNLNRAWYNRLLENRQTIAEQLDAMAYIMKDCAKEETGLNRKKRRALEELRYLAGEKGIIAEGVYLSETAAGHLKLEIWLRSKRGGCIPIKTFLKILPRVTGKRMRPVSDTRNFITKEGEKYLFYEDTRYRSVRGIARLKKDGAQISGDNFSVLELEQGAVLLGLSDGMGSGSVACRESEMVLDLVERFLEAGFTVETAIRMMNSAMVMKGENDLYSTADLCTIDLYDGAAEFYKIGAAGSFLKRDGETSSFLAESLPVGTGMELQIARKKTQLKSGDLIVMVTDGVLEYLHVPKPEETMQEIIESIDTDHPGVLAKKILERVLLFTGGKVPDDMTVLTACIWEK